MNTVLLANVNKLTRRRFILKSHILVANYKGNLTFTINQHILSSKYFFKTDLTNRVVNLFIQIILVYLYLNVGVVCS